ncbi:hypothetical protein [Desulforamulus ruminis]|uniref:Uncharacterized protein n=1 Tax=Desulforamulus ruminis (strain ATCC 23193 / DSM 2154 / NCIMB 8452 / DL) TaxID=696281 RepID=F6DTE1_DESRL|nr:hypothetical protein [Desulforamulus ruminis]AEG58958.1 hypothetical protein Desru_0673 [Desulforamulus ruminis DSM 2154]
MKRWSIWGILVCLFLVPGTAHAGPKANEEVIGSSIISSYYAIWNYPNQPTRYQAMPTGGSQLGNLSLGQSVPSYYADYGFPFGDKVSQYKNIRVEVVNPENISSTEYGKANIWRSGLSHDVFLEKYINCMPTGFNVSLASSESQYNSVRVKWDLNLNYVDESHSRRAVDIKSDPTAINYYVPTWGSSPPSGFAESTLAWLWTLPVQLIWYGEPIRPHDLQFTDAAPTLFGNIEAGKTVTGNIRLKNFTSWPTLPSTTQFRVYTWAQGDAKPLLHNTKNISLGGLSNGLFSFQFTCPGKPFILILTADMYHNGRWINEPLTVTTSSGPVCKLEEEYVRNKVEVPLVPGSGGAGQPSNLSVTKMELQTPEGNPVGGYVTVNTPYKVQAQFKSTFDQPGWAKIRLYEKRSTGTMLPKDESNAYFSANGEVSKTWDWTGLSTNVTLYATVSYRWWDQQSQWVEELFNDQRETTYADNKMELSTTGTDIPEGPPTPGNWAYPVYYHPVVEEMIPIYGTIEHRHVVPGWVEIPYTHQDKEARIRVRLIE